MKYPAVELHKLKIQLRILPKPILSLRLPRNSATIFPEYLHQGSQNEVSALQTDRKSPIQRKGGREFRILLYTEERGWGRFLSSHSRCHNLENVPLDQDMCFRDPVIALGCNRVQWGQKTLHPERTEGAYCSFQIRPVTLSLSSFRSPPEKKSAIFL